MSAKDWINKYATTATTGLFLVSAVSGVALFFHVAPGTFSEMHEWLSMLLLIPVALHLQRNWGAFVGYFRRRSIYLPVLLSLAAGIAFPAASLFGGGAAPVAGMGRIVSAMQTATISEAAGIFDVAPQALIDHLAKQGLSVAGPDDKLSDIATRSGQSARDVVMSATSVPAAN